MHFLMLLLYVGLALFVLLALGFVGLFVYCHKHPDALPRWEKKIEQWSLDFTNRSFEAMNQWEERHRGPSRFERFASKFGRWFLLPFGVLTLFFALGWGTAHMQVDGLLLIIIGFVLSLGRE